MSLDLGLTPAQRDEHGERQELPGLKADAGARVVVPEAVGGQKVLEVQLVVGRAGVHLIHDVGAHDLLLDCETFLLTSLRYRGRLPLERQPDATVGEDIVGCVYEVEDLSHAHVGDSLIDDLLDLYGRDAHG